MEKKSSEALKHKRSFFVRMVSDPKLYNPKIVKVRTRNKLSWHYWDKTASRWIGDRESSTWAKRQNAVTSVQGKQITPHYICFAC